MSDLSWLLAVGGGPLIILGLGYALAPDVRGQRLQSLGIAAGAALAANIALDVVHTVLFTTSAEAFDDPFLSMQAGPVLISLMYLMALAVVAHFGWLAAPHGLRDGSRIAALPDANSLMLVGGALILAAAGLAAMGRTEPPVVLSTYVFLSLFVFGFYWPMLCHALGEDGLDLPWRTIALAAVVALNPLPDLWDALRSNGESLSNGLLARLVSQGALLVLLGIVRAKAKSVLAVFVVGFGGHLAAVAGAGAL